MGHGKSKHRRHASDEAQQDDTQKTPPPVSVPASPPPASDDSLSKQPKLIELLPSVFYIAGALDAHEQESLAKDVLDASRHFTTLEVSGQDTFYHEIMSMALESDPESHLSHAVSHIIDFIDANCPEGIEIPRAVDFKHLTGYLYPYNGKLAAHCDKIQGWAILISLGCTANLNVWRQGHKKGLVPLDFASGDIILFPTDSKSAIMHSITSISAKSLPSHLAKVLQPGTRLSLQYRQTLRTEAPNAEDFKAAGKMSSVYPRAVDRPTLVHLPWIEDLKNCTPTIQVEGIQLPAELVPVILESGSDQTFSRLSTLLVLSCRGFYASINFGKKMRKATKRRIKSAMKDFDGTQIGGNEIFSVHKAAWHKFKPGMLSSTKLQHLHVFQSTSTDDHGFSVEAGHAVVNVCGSSSFMSGFAGDDEPIATIPSLYCTDNSIRRGICAGFPARRLRDQQVVGAVHNNFEFVCPVAEGRLTNVDALVALWEESSLHHLHINPAAHYLLHSVRSSTVTHKEGALAAIEAAFERYGTSEYYDASSSVLSLYSCGVTTGIVVDIGANSTCIVAVFEGYMLPNTMTTYHEISGDHITRQMESVLRKTHPQLDSLLNWNVAEYVKCKMVKVPSSAADIDDLSTFHLQTDQSPEVFHISLSKEWLQLGEQMITPPNASRSLADLIWETLQKCDEEGRKDIIANICLSGAPAATPGFASRLQSDLQRLVEPLYRTKVHLPAQPQFSPWVGGSILGSLSTFSKMWISRVEYEESGPGIVLRKCF